MKKERMLRSFCVYVLFCRRRLRLHSLFILQSFFLFRLLMRDHFHSRYLSALAQLHQPHTLRAAPNDGNLLAGKADDP